MRYNPYIRTAITVFIGCTFGSLCHTEGAWFPVALNLAGRVVTSPLAKHYMSNAGLVYGTYQAGKKMSGAGGKW